MDIEELDPSSMDMNMDMGMTIYFSEEVTYIFSQLKVGEKQYVLFIFSLILVFGFGFLVQAILGMTDLVEVNEKREQKTKRWGMATGKALALFGLNFALFLCSVIGMMLLMTCNGYVILALIAGNGIGYFLLVSKGKLRSEDNCH